MATCGLAGRLAIFFFCCDELQDIGFSEAFQLILSCQTHKE